MQKSEKILLIGANGSVGKFLVRQLAPKFETVALLRSEPKFDASLYPNLKIIKGDASSQEDIDEATKGVSIIISTYPNAKSGPNDALNYINRVISSMKKNVPIFPIQHVAKLISVSGFGLVPVS
jgi:putative NADH-flavin reductase